MKTIDLNSGNQKVEKNSMNHFFKEALTLEELFSIRGGNSDSDSDNDKEEEGTKKKYEGSPDDHQDDALID
mgnify:CR=1 FL=1